MVKLGKNMPLNEMDFHFRYIKNPSQTNMIHTMLIENTNQLSFDGNHWVF